MQLFTLLPLLSLLTGINGSPSCASETHEWIPPQRGDRRSPCPGLNAIANHAFLPRDGSNISLETLTRALNESANLHSSLSEFLGGLSLQLSTTGDPSTFHLSDIAAHGDCKHMTENPVASPEADVAGAKVIEHDASLSRADAYFGDHVSLNRTIWAESKSILFAKDPIPLEAFAKAREARFEASMAENPEFHVTDSQKDGSLLEMAVIARLFQTNDSGGANSEWIRILFGKCLMTKVHWISCALRTDPNRGGETSILRGMDSPKCGNYSG